MFDRVEIAVVSGDGGDGVVSFRREKFVPYGGPDGGDGGNGGDVIITADPAITDLRGYRRKKIYRAANGAAGRGKKQHGQQGGDLILTVPVGTMVSYSLLVGADALVADLNEPGQQVVVARGGQGGLGNTHFTSSINQAPRIALKGRKGEQHSLILELRLIADIGIIGYPNAGKSTLLAAASAARPKIASYPFTTREPVLGVVEVGPSSAVMAEIPGLIDGAHLGRGLGHDFLRHIVRTRILIHLIDGSSTTLIEDMMRVNMELTLFDSALAQKTQLVAVNKIDLPQVRSRLEAIRQEFNLVGINVYYLSAAIGEGVPELITEAVRVLGTMPDKTTVGAMATPKKIFRPVTKKSEVRVYKEGELFVVESPEMERVILKGGAVGAGVPYQLRRQMSKLGVTRALEQAGVKPGDRVRCGDMEWEWD